MKSNHKQAKEQSSRFLWKRNLDAGGLLAGYLLTCTFNPILANSGTEEKVTVSKLQKPNILLIVTDQMSASMLSCTGNKYVHTPNLDRLANSGIRFERAYSTNPVCAPSRYSLFSGDMPSQIGMSRNGHLSRLSVPQEKLILAMGNIFKKESYETVYGGKTHLVGRDGKHDHVELYGFDNLTSDYYDELVSKSCAFIKQKHDKPFLLVASLVNPHDICYMVIQDYEKSQGKRELTVDPTGKYRLPQAMQKPIGVNDEEFFEKYCPPLPDNFEVPDQELTAFMADKPAFTLWARKNFTEEQWRMHRWAYARLTEMVDKQIGQILDAIEESGIEENTIIIYTSDHGEQDGAHRTDEKAFLYEESVRVPFLISWKNKIKPQQVNNSHLVSNGLDLLPTMCDLAGISIPDDFKGLSVKPLMVDGLNKKWRRSLVVESNIARLVIWDTFKYMVGKEVSNSGPVIYDPFERNPARMMYEFDPKKEVREMLIDLKSDPGEMKNLAFSKKYEKKLLKGRYLLAEWYKDHEFTFEEGYKMR